MPAIRYSASSFATHWGPQLTGQHRLAVSWHELVWAAVTVGKPGFAFLFAHGWHSISDLIVRVHSVYANLKEVRGQFEKSSLYNASDPTEKSGVSYSMGMIAAKVLCHRLFNVPWLFHVSMINDIGGHVILKETSQPDLVGLRRTREWVVVEAKGRTSAYSASAMSSAKLQTRQLRQVNGQFPSLRVAVQAYFTPKLHWALLDPDEFDADAPDVEFDEEEALDRYYSPAVAAIAENAEERQIAGRVFLAREITEIGVSLAIDRAVREQVATRTLLRGEEALAPDIKVNAPADKGFVVFADGLAVALDERWSETRMTRDPRVRRDG